MFPEKVELFPDSVPRVKSVVSVNSSDSPVPASVAERVESVKIRLVLPGIAKSIVSVERNIIFEIVENTNELKNLEINEFRVQKKQIFSEQDVIFQYKGFNKYNEYLELSAQLEIIDANGNLVKTVNFNHSLRPLEQKNIY